MFAKENADVNDYIESSKAIPSSFSGSLGRGLGTSLLAPAAAGEAITASLSGIPAHGGALDVLKMWQSEENAPGASGLGFFAGDAIGFALNPLTWATGGLASGAARGVGAKLGVTAASSRGAQFAVKGAALGGEFAGQMLPQHIASEYDSDENRIDAFGLAKSVGIDFGMGVAFAAVPFAWGFLRNKMGKKGGSPKEGTPEVSQESLDAALGEKTITQAEHAFSSAMLKGETPSLDIVQQVMASSKLPFDATSGHVNVSLLTTDNMKALNNTVADALGSVMDSETKSALNNYIIKGQLSEIIKNPKMIDGLQGVIDHMSERIAKKGEHFAKIDALIEPYIRKGLTETEALSQSHLRWMIKVGKNLGGVTVPKNVKDVIKHEAAHDKIVLQRKEQLTKIAELETQLSHPAIKEEGARLAKNKRDAAQERLKEIELNLIESEAKAPKLLHPADEMEFLKGTLTGKQFYRKLTLNEDFARLTDLTAHWGNAKTLHKRVLREEMYEQQEAFKNIAEMLVNLSKNPDMIAGSKDGVTSYLTNRIGSKVREAIDSRAAKAEAAITKPLDKSSEGIQKQFDELEALATNEETKAAIRGARAKVAELANDEAIESFFKCITGAAV